MQSASAEGRNWGSPSAMGMDESSAKKARLELPNGYAKQEPAGEGGPGAGVAAEYGSRVELAVKIDRRVLHCPLCSRPYKPTVFKCKAGGHFACAVCVNELPGGLCVTCENGGGDFDPCPDLDIVFSSMRIACPNAGCGRFVVYHEAGEHQDACPHAPCHCTEPGCVGFTGSPAALAGHLTTVHAVPVRNVKYGQVSQLQVSESVPRLLLVAAEDDGRVFLLTTGALGGTDAAAVSVVCVRASAAARPRFTCTMWANRSAPAASSRNDKVLAELQMRSSTSPGAVIAVDEPTFLTVPPMYLVPGPGDKDGPSMEVTVSVRIDKVSPWAS